jgi:hypothetical protein
MSASIVTYERSTLVNSEKYIGLDVHQATISVAVMDSTGKVVMESILETKAATIPEFFAGLPDIPLYRSGVYIQNPNAQGHALSRYFTNQGLRCLTHGFG